MGITNAGLAPLSGLTGNTGAYAAFTYLALGSGNTAFAATQTALVTEFSTIGLSRASATVSQTTTTQTNDTLKLTHSWSVTGSGTIKEAGVFNDASAGTMLARKVLSSSQAVSNGSTYVYTYSIIFA